MTIVSLLIRSTVILSRLLTKMGCCMTSHCIFVISEKLTTRFAKKCTFLQFSLVLFIHVRFYPCFIVLNWALMRGEMTI